MSIKEHRIYKYMSEPFRFIGLTLDEIGLFLGGFACFMWVESVSYKLPFLFMGSAGVYFVKKFKKLATGFSLTSYLHWNLGVRLGLSKQWPESWKRIFLP